MDAKEQTVLIVSVVVVALLFVGSIAGLTISLLSAGVGPVAESELRRQPSTDNSGLGDPSYETSRVAAKRLIRDKPERLVALAVNGNAKERSRAVRALGWSKDPKYLDAYLNAAVDPDRYVRMAAIGAIGNLQPDKTLCDRLTALRGMEQDESAIGLWDEVIPRMGCQQSP